MMGLPDADTLARMGRAAENALLSEQGDYEVGKAAWLALETAEVAALPDNMIDTSDIPEAGYWPVRQVDLNAKYEVQKAIRKARGI